MKENQRVDLLVISYLNSKWKMTFKVKYT